MGKRAKFLAVALVFSTGCSAASAHKRTYIAGAVTKQVVTESHEIYSKQLNAKVDECDPESNSSVETEEQFDECLGVFSHNDKVVTALEVYKEAAETLFEILKDPEAAKEKLEAARRDVLNAAYHIIDLLPEGGKIRNQLEGLVGK
jgi:hypothetical protein